MIGKLQQHQVARPSPWEVIRPGRRTSFAAGTRVEDSRTDGADTEKITDRSAF